MFIVKHRCSGITIARFKTSDEALECVENLERNDKANDEYEPSSYIIDED